MASGTPVIALDRPVTRCVIDHRKDGLLVPNSVNGIMSGLAELLTNPKLAADMQLAGKTKVAMRFAWPVVEQQIREVYDLADGHPSQSNAMGFKKAA